jgi:hypothetical protein
LRPWYSQGNIAGQNSSVIRNFVILVTVQYTEYTKMSFPCKAKTKNE